MGLGEPRQGPRCPRWHGKAQSAAKTSREIYGQLPESFQLARHSNASIGPDAVGALRRFGSSCSRADFKSNWDSATTVAAVTSPKFGWSKFQRGSDNR